MKTKNILITSISSLIFSGAVMGGAFLAHTNANVDKLDLLTRAVQDDKVKELQRARGDIKIESGGKHSGAIIGNRLYMWGYNVYGQIGNGSLANVLSPIRINVPNGIISELSLGIDSSGVIIDNNVYTWGRNEYGQLGTGDTAHKYTPQFVLSGANSLSLGEFHSGAIVNGTIYMWGRNDWGQVGDDSYVTRTRPTKVYDKNIKGMYARELSVGFKHSGAILTNPKNGNRRELYTWGLNTNRELGYSSGAYDHWEYPYAVDDINKLSGTLQSISFGGVNSSAIVSGSLYTWGDNGEGQLGIGTTTKWEWVSRVTSISNVTSVRVAKVDQPLSSFDNAGHMIAINSSGSLYLWGRNSQAQIGDGRTTSSSRPQLIESSNVSAISCSSNASFAIIDGKLHSWGSSSGGVLGNGINSNGLVSRPTLINIKENYIINLNSSNDPYNKRNDVVYNVIKNKNDIVNIVEASSTLINLPRNYNVSNVQAIGTTQNNTGRISTIVDAAFPIVNHITIDGFLPVKETAQTKLSPKEVPIIDNTFSGESIVELVKNANSDSTGTQSELAKWIINNSTTIIGTLQTYTQDFPENAKIVKADGFVLKSWLKGEIEFNIYVNKYYEKSGNNIILSTSNAPVKLTTKISLSGLPQVVSYQDCIDFNGKIQILETQIDPQTSADKFFVAITGNVIGGTVINKALLGQYINIRFIPADAIITIDRDMTIIQGPNEINQEVGFTLTTDKYYWLGVLIDTPNPPLTEYISFTILRKISNIFLKDNIEDFTSQITTGDALKLMSSGNTIESEASKYLNFENFPLSTLFTLGDSIVNDNESGILNLSIKASRYYDLELLDYYDKNKIFNDIKISGFKPSYDISIYPVNNNNEIMQSSKSKNEFFDEVINNNVVNRSFLSQYLDFRSIPENAELSIPRMDYKDDSTIQLTVRVDRYYDNGGVTIVRDYETTILIKLEKFDIIWIIILSASGLFLLFLITCIIICIRNKRKIKDR